MKRIKSHLWFGNTAGFSILEMLLAVTLFSLFLVGFLSSYLYGQQSGLFGGQRTRAVFLAEEGLEAVRNMRDADYANLINGVHGLAISENQWVFSGTSDTTDDFFTREIEIIEIDSHRKEIFSRVSWQQTPIRQESVELVTHLTNWARPVEIEIELPTT